MDEINGGPQSYTGLAEGHHVFQVRAVDNAGNIESTATFAWDIDTTSPSASITSSPSNPTNSTSASFSFTGADPVSGGVSSGVNHFEVALDGGGFATATSSQSYTGLSEGPHTFFVRAVDNAGNTGAAVAFTWVVDVTGPTAVATTPNVVAAGGTVYTFTVTVTDAVGVAVGSLDSLDVRVTGPGGFDEPATFVTVDHGSNGSPRTATYTITPPGGSWNIGDNGTYTVVLQSGQVLDTAGNAATAGSIGSFEVAVVAPPTVTGVVLNAGAAQRSRLTEIRIDFDQVVTLPGNPADAFQLRRQSDSAQVGLTAVVTTDTVTHMTLTFTGAVSEHFSLEDGRYTLTVLAGQVASPGGQLDGNGNGAGGDDFVLVGDTVNAPKLYRFFGDIDADGDVDTFDFLAYRMTHGKTASDPGFNGAFDADDDDDVDGSDFLRFRANAGNSI